MSDNLKAQVGHLKHGIGHLDNEVERLENELVRVKDDRQNMINECESIERYLRQQGGTKS